MSALSMTLLSRVSDGLPLAASMEDEKDHREMDSLKNQAKKIVKQLTASSSSKVSIDNGASFFHYINAGGVCFRLGGLPFESRRRPRCGGLQVGGRLRGNSLDARGDLEPRRLYLEPLRLLRIEKAKPPQKPSEATRSHHQRASGAGAGR